MHKTRITVHGKSFRLYLTQQQIETRITEISDDLLRLATPEPPVFLVILTGGFMFGSELIKRFPQDCNIQFCKISSYQGLQSSGKVEVENLEKSFIEHRDIILVEDLIDTGRTLHTFVPQLQQFSPRSIRLVTLLSKPDSIQFPIQIDHVGFEIPNLFVVGYGLDYDGLGRNYPQIYLLDS